MPPADLEHLEFRLPDVTLRAVAAGPREGPLVLLLHGFPEFCYGWRRQIKPLAEAGFRVVAPDQRGYNCSSKPKRVEAYSLHALAGDVVGIADLLERDRFDLVGHDWGGIVAWWVALKYPQRVRRLVVLNAPHPVAARSYFKAHAGQLLKSWYIAAFQVPGLPERMLAAGGFAPLRRALTGSAPPGLFSSGDLEAYRKAWAELGALTGMLNWYRALPAFRTKGTPKRLRQPTLILWGDRDQFLDFGLAEASGAFCDRAEIVRLRGASHWVQHERAEEVNRAIIGFLREESPA